MATGNIRNTRRNYARPSGTTTLGATPGTPSFADGSYRTNVTITRNTNPLGPTGNGTFTISSSPAGFTTTTTTITSTAATTVNISIPTTASSGDYFITVAESNYNGIGKVTTTANSINVVTSSLFNADVTVVGGGGAGGAVDNQGTGVNTMGGGGGAGAYRDFNNFTLGTGTNFTVTIGAGGTTGVGSNSIFSTITAAGGGSGRNQFGATTGNGNSSSTAGGSGGGASGTSGDSTTRVGGTYSAPTSPAIVTGKEMYTFTGFAGGGRNAINQSGGGGGSAEAGTSNSTNPAGGTGTYNYLISDYFCGGGGGSGLGASGNGGLGGGGSGRNSNGNGGNGQGNRGAGGGGSYDNSGNYRIGGSGGSGIVIIRYPIARTITIGAGLTGSTTNDGTYNTTTITAGTGNVSFA